MELDERKLKILQAIIRTYLDTGEPVGSRTISKYSELNLSSATIRNEMADLEEMGYILQPHTSAGRIPSDKGYRLYVDTMMEAKESEVNSLKEELEEKAGRVDDVLKQVAKFLAANTNYATMVSGPKYQSKRVKFIQITSVDEEHLLAVIVLDNNSVKNQMIRVDEAVEAEVLLKLNFILNTTLNGLDVVEMNLALIQRIKEQMETHTQVIDSVLEVIGKTLLENDDPEIYTSGTTNILKYPELADKSKAAEIISAFEDKETFHSWLGLSDREMGNDTHDIQVYIGDENNVASMRDCSMVTATYQIREGVYGKIGIVGPKRMDYDKVVGTLNSLMGQLDDIFKEK
ncbi:MAG: heat-inducible transcription repressor HrcA [Lachnospiraceae bacterium]|nr:heat-inducible transcription repressor HrcA [Lachnospiraceae bacterium]